MSGPTPEKAMLGIPDRWMYCPKTGKMVADLFFPFKTPLCSLYDNQIEKRLQFHPSDAQKHPQLKGRKIGLWIDLTKTDRYYSKDEVENAGCKYRKMKLAGHKATPTREETDQFIRYVHGFLADNPNGIVGVHCTHGFNRTGFLICAYLVLQKDWAIDAAIREFASKRPCGIYKQDYINELFERFEGGADDAFEAPDRPTWEYGEERGLIDDTNVDDSGAGPSNGNGASANGNSAQNGTPEGGKGGKVFMEGKVRGVELLGDQTKKKMLQGKIKELCGANKAGFPGSQPVSMECSPSKNNLQFLAQKPYMVSWKADGMRYMVYICDEDEVFAFDRDNEVFVISGLRFPSRKEPRHVRNTLVDAEMIIDHVVDQSGERDVPRLLIYDIIHFEAFPLAKQDFVTRRACIKKELIEPRNRAIMKGEINKELEPMSVRIKEFWEITAVPKFFEKKFTQTVGHEIDGLIFQPVYEPYRPGTQDTVLKWKPPSHNSIDFKLEIRKICRDGELPKWTGFLYVVNHNEPMCEMKATKTLQKYDGKIIECTYQNGQWVFMRERTDKSHANAFRTAMSVWNSMQHPITQEGLCSFVMKNAVKWHVPQEPAPPQQKRPRH